MCQVDLVVGVDDWITDPYEVGPHGFEQVECECGIEIAFAGADIIGRIIQCAQGEAAGGVEIADHRKACHRETVGLILVECAAHRDGHFARLEDIAITDIGQMIAAIVPSLRFGCCLFVADGFVNFVECLSLNRNDITADGIGNRLRVSTAVDHPRFGFANFEEACRF